LDVENKKESISGLIHPAMNDRHNNETSLQVRRKLAKIRSAIVAVLAQFRRSPKPNKILDSNVQRG
jgi:hypothetical protein